MSYFTLGGPFNGSNVDTSNETPGEVLTVVTSGEYDFLPPGGGGDVDTIVAGDGIDVDSTDPTNPIVSNDGVITVVAGSNITVDNTDPQHPIVAGTGGGGGVAGITAGNATITIGGTPTNPTVVVTAATFDASGAAAAAQAASQPLDADLTTIAGLTATTNNFLQSVAGAWASRTPTQSAATLAAFFDAAGAAAAAQAASQPLDSDLSTIAGLTATTDNIMQSKAGAWASRTLDQVSTDLAALGYFQPFYWNPVSGQYYFPRSGSGVFVGNPFTNGVLVFVPIWIPEAVTLTRLGFHVVTTPAGAGGLMRLGIYSDTGAFAPNTLILDAGTVSVTTTGTKEITISQALPVGWVWLAHVVQGAPSPVPTVNAIQDYFGNEIPVLALGTTAPNSAALSGTWSQTGVTGALPGTATPATTNNSGLRMFVKIA